MHWAYALAMRREMSNGGKWFAGLGLTAVVGYLTATVAAGGRHPDWPYFVFGAVAMIGFGMYLTGRGGWHASAVRSLGGIYSNPGEELRGRIAGLPIRSKVAYQQSVGGVVTGVPAGVELWLLVRPLKEGRFWPQERLFLDTNGRFRALARFGRGVTSDVGEEFLLLLVAAPMQAGEEFRTRPRERGLDELPEGVKTLNQRTVIRRLG